MEVGLLARQNATVWSPAHNAIEHEDLGELQLLLDATFNDVVENRVAVGDWFMPELHTSHPLLLDYLDDSAKLYFSKHPKDTREVIRALGAAHHEVLGPWRPISRYLHPYTSTEALLAGGNGQLADGPITLINKMAEMTSGQLRTSTVIGEPPRHWNGQQLTDRAGSETSLFMGSAEWGSYPSQPRPRSYVIAASCSIVPADQTDD